MAKKKNFVNYKGHKIPRNIVNDMYVYDNFLMSNNPDNISPKYYSKNSDIYYGSTLDFYVDQIEKGLNPTDVQNDFTNEFSGIVKEYGYLDNNFLDKYETKINESNEIRNNIFETQKKYTDKKWYEPQFSYNNKTKKYQETLQGYRDQYKEKLDEIIPSFKNIDDMKLTPQQEFAKQYIELQKNGNEAIFEMNADILNKQGIGGNYDVSKKISDELTILQFPELEEGVKTRKTYGEYLDNVFDTLGEMYDTSNLNKDKNGKYEFKMKQQYLDDMKPEIDDFIKENNLLLNDNNLAINNEIKQTYDPYNGLNQEEIKEYRKMYDDWQKTLAYDEIDNLNVDVKNDSDILDLDDDFEKRFGMTKEEYGNRIFIDSNNEDTIEEKIFNQKVKSSIESENSNTILNNPDISEFYENKTNEYGNPFNNNSIIYNYDSEDNTSVKDLEKNIQNIKEEVPINNNTQSLETKPELIEEKPVLDMFGNEISQEEIENRKKASNTDTRTGAGTDTRTGAGTDTRTGAGTDTRTGAGTDTRTGAGTDTRTGAGTDTDTGRTKAEDFMKGGRYYNSKNSQRNNNNDRTINDGFNYGEKNSEDSITVRELLSDIYGDDYDDVKAREFVYDLAKTKGGKEYLKDKEIYKDKYRHGDLIINSKNGAVSETVGSELAKKYYDDVVDKDNNINRNKIIEISDQYKKYGNLDKVEDSFNKNIRKNIFDKEYSKVEKDFKLKSSKIEEEGRKISEVLKKISDEKVLLPEEVESFRNYQKLIGDTKEEMRTWAENLGYSAESVFGEEFKLTPYEKKKNKSNKKLKNYSEDTGDVEGTRLYQFNKGSFNTVNYRDIKYSDIKMNDDGTWTTYSEETKKTLKEELGTLEEDQEYFKAVRDSKLNKDNYLDYLSKNKEALSDDTAKKLYNLQQKDGVDIGDEGRQVLQGLAIAHYGKLKEKNGAVTKLNTALETLSSENYMNIKDDNIDRIGKGLVYKDNKYQLDMDKLNLTDEQKNSEAFKKIIESDNVGTEDLKGIFDASTINNYIQGKNIDEKEFNKIIGEKVSGLEDSKYDTGLNIKEQLKKRGIEDNKIIDEIANTKNNGTDNLSAEAKVAIATMKDPLDQNEIDFGSINKDKIKEYINNNKGFFGDPKDIENMNEKELYGLFGKAFEGTVTSGNLAKGYDFKVKGKDVTTAEGFTEFYNSVLGKDGKDLDWDKVFNSLGATEEGKAQFKDAFEWMKGKKGQKEFKQMNIANSARDYLVKMFDEASKNENIDAKTKEQIKKHAEILKTKKMDDVASKVDVDSITKDIGKFDKIGKEAGKGIVDSIKGGGKWKTIGGAALTLGGLGTLGMFASNAAEERERKRQEMQQLMMAQNQSIRGGY